MQIRSLSPAMEPQHDEGPGGHGLTKFCSRSDTQDSKIAQYIYIYHILLPPSLLTFPVVLLVIFLSALKIKHT